MKKPLVVFTGAALATIAALAGLKMTDWPAGVPEAQTATKGAEEAAGGGAGTETAAEKPAEVAAVQPTETPKAETPETAAPAKPQLDTVRVEADGQAVVAGRAQPGSEVSLKLGNETLGKGIANAEGAWVVVPDNPLPKGANEITVEQKAADGTTTASEQSIAVAVPEQPGQQAMVALTEPGAATKVLQAGGAPEQPAAPSQAEKPSEPAQQTAEAQPAQPAPEQAPAPAAQAPAAEAPAAETTAPPAQQTAEAPATEAPAQKTEAPAEGAGTPPSATEAPAQETAAVEPPAAEGTTAAKPAETAAPEAQEAPAKPADVALRLDAVDYNDKGDIIFSGRGKPGTAIRLYVDNGSVGDAIVDSAGNWSFAGNDIIAPGTHTLRADQIDGTGKVMARIELPFQREDAAAVAALNAPAQPEPQPQPQPQLEATEAAPAPAPQTTEVAKTEPEAAAPTTTAPAAEEPATPPSTPEPGSQQAAAAPEAKPVEPDKPRAGKVVIQPGNNLWKLSRVIYGRGVNYTVIYDANKEQIRNPDLIYPGQIFAIPNANPPESIDPKRHEPLTSAEGGAAQ